MQIPQTIIGFTLMVVGSVAVVDPDLGNAGWWLVAGLAGAIGTAGLVTAVRPPSSRK